ncbi:MAG: septum formation initiator [Gracilibacter sp. BRH_c7a]|nr:MAG: septum formation initiator [Gracilibacter sp. BRH_c7a]
MLMAQRKIQYDEPFAYQDIEPKNPVPKKVRPIAKKAVSSANNKGIRNFVMMMVVIVIFGLIGAKTVHITVVKGAEIRALEKEITALNVENGLLQVEVDKLRSVGRIEQAALAMGMEKPEGTIYIASNIIQPEKELGVEKTQMTAQAPGDEKATSVLDNVFKIFTSFFASTQR